MDKKKVKIFNIGNPMEPFEHAVEKFQKENNISVIETYEIDVEPYWVMVYIEESKIRLRRKK